MTQASTQAPVRAHCVTHQTLNPKPTPYHQTLQRGGALSGIPVLQSCFCTCTSNGSHQLPRCRRPLGGRVWGRVCLWTSHFLNSLKGVALSSFSFFPEAPADYERTWLRPLWCLYQPPSSPDPHPKAASSQVPRSCPPAHRPNSSANFLASSVRPRFCSTSTRSLAAFTACLCFCK